MSDFDNYLAEQLKDPEFKKEWDAQAPERDIMRAMIEARIETGISQKELAARTGINQANISKIEQGNYNPSIKVLQRIANGLGKELHIEFR